MTACLRLAICSLLLMTPGCLRGPSLQHFAPANEPHGIAATIRLSDDRPGLNGELLAVRDDGLVIATKDRVVLVRYAAIRDARFADKASLRIGAGRPPGPDKRHDLLLLSRFPQGLDGTVRKRLLAAYGQQDWEVIQ